MRRLTKIISGGQTGVDQAALRAARDCGLEIGGWCPPGRRCEAGVIPKEFPLKETPHDPSPDAPALPRSQRTEWNVRDSDGTLVIVSDGNRSGCPTNVAVVKSTGHDGLDRKAVFALRQWRFKPGKLRKVDMPITFHADGTLYLPPSSTLAPNR